MGSQVPLADGEGREAIAVVGMSCRFPGEGTNIEDFWDMMRDGRDAWSKVPASRFNSKGWYHPDPNRPGSFHIRGAHFIRGDIAAFDAPFFSISTAEAVSMDPQQRMLLEVVYEALDSAGIPSTSLSNTATSVFCGSFVRDYEQPCMRDPDTTPPYSATGNGIAILANRVSHVFDFTGTSQTIDTGCSASTIAVHQACKSLLSGESSVGIAAGVGLIFSPNTLVPMANLNILSPNGRCFTFDKRANGYGRGEGIGVLVLKRLEDAIKSNDTIRAVIRATSSNQDGHTQGITLPSEERQIENMTNIYRNAGLDKSRTAYFECHGTGTQAGDSKEVRAVAKVFRRQDTPENPLIIGSVKTNIGHLEGSAGVAGLIKGILVVERGHIPKHLNFTSPNPNIDFDGMNMQIATEFTPWPVPGLRRASVNSFGFGGTNAHVVLDDVPHYLKENGITAGQHNSFLFPDDALLSETVAVDKDPKTRLFVFSGHDEPGLGRVIDSQTKYVQKHMGDDGSGDGLGAGISANYSYTLFSRRSRLNWRTFVTAGSTAELVQKLQDKDMAKPLRAMSHSPSRVALVFCGQGAQWFAMGRELLSYDVFRASVVEASSYMATTLHSPFHIWDELQRGAEASHIDEPQISQPATTVLQVALVDLLVASGIQPAAVVGHSSGEIAAAYAVGAVRREDAWQIAYSRGQCVSRIAALAPDLHGGMLAVAVSEEGARSTIAETGVESVDVACVNGPASVTLSGDAAEIARLCEVFRSQNVRASPVKVSAAYHSHHMRVVESIYRDSLQGVAPVRTTATGAFFSSVYGHKISTEQMTAEYWVRNLVRPVQFYQAVSSMVREADPELFLEVSPHRVWESTLQQICSSVPTTATKSSRSSPPEYFSLLHRGKDASSTTLAVMGELWMRGFPINLDWTFPSNNKPRHLVDVPSYPWDHSRKYWHESHLSKANRFRSHGREDIIGAPLENSTPQDPRWRGFFRVQENPWLEDHIIQKSIIYPAGGMVAMAIEAAKQLAEPRQDVLGYEVTDFVIAKPMLIPTSAQGLENMLSAHLLEPADNAQNGAKSIYEFSILSKPQDAPWIKHGSGRFSILYTAGGAFASQDQQAATKAHRLAYRLLSEKCYTELVPRQFYESLDVVGMTYGPHFRNLAEIQRGDNAACSVVRIPDTKASMPFQFEFPHIIHPATLDAMLQSVLALGDGEDEAMLPCSIGRIFVSATLPKGAGSRFRGYTTAQKTSERTASAWIVMLDDRLETQAVKIENIEFKSVPGQPDGGRGGYLPSHRNLCSEVVWKQDIASVTVLGSALPDHLSRLLQLVAHKNPALSILHHTDAASSNGLFAGSAVSKAVDFVDTQVLDPLTRGLDTPHFSRLVLSGENSHRVQEHLGTLKRVYQGMDRIHASSQVPEDERFDVVLSVETESGNGDIVRLGERAASGGCFIFVPSRDTGLDKSRLEEAYSVLMGAGYSVTKAPGDIPTYLLAQKAANASSETKHSKLMLVLPDNMSSFTILLKNTVRSILQAQLDAEISETAFSSIVSLPRPSIAVPCISLVELDDPVIFSMNENNFDSVHRLLTTAKSLLWLTRGAQIDAKSPVRSPFIGLSRTLRSEDAKKKIVSLDLDMADGVNELPANLAASIAYAFKQACTATGPVSRMSDDIEFVYSGGRLMIPRLMPLTALNHQVERRQTAPSLVQVPLNTKGKALRLDPSSIGKPHGPLFIGDDGEAFHPLRPDEVRIAVTGTYLLPEDIVLDSNRSTCSIIGTDVFGHVLEVGADVEGLQPRDRVVALDRDTIKTHTIVHQADVRLVKGPATWKWYCPKAFWTAMYAFRTSRRLFPGDVVLVYGTSTAYGQVAIRLAVALGGKVLAACSSSREKQLLKQKLRVPDDQILDTEDTNNKFEFDVLSMSGGQGADIVFDPTSQHIAQAFRCVSECGRVIRTALKSCPDSVWSLPGKNVSLETIDIGHLAARRPREAARLAADVEETLQLVPGLGTLHDVEEYNVCDLLSALQTSPDGLFGSPRVLLTGNDDSSSHKPGANLVNMPVTTTDKTDKTKLSPSATYLLVGGLGGLGRSIAEHLAKRGATHIAFFSRSGAASSSAQSLLTKLYAKGVDARAFTVDICNKEEVVDVLAHVQRVMPAIRGAIQCAAVVDDAVFPSMDYGRWKKSFQPKTTGSYNLHELLPRDMDFFVFLSSSSGVIGNRGQANYAAGNSFQDALARHRSAHGMHSVSLDLGLVLGAGMVAENEALLDAMRASGFFGIRLQDALLILDRAMARPDSGDLDLPAQVVTTVGTGGLTIQNQPSDPFWTRSALFRYLNQVDAPPHGLSGGGNGAGAGAGASDLRSMIRAAGSSVQDATDVVCKQLIATIARRKGMVPDDFDRDQPLGSYGIDSLDSIFVLGWVSRESGITVQTVEGVTIAELGRDVAQRTMDPLREEEEEE